MCCNKYTKTTDPGEVPTKMYKALILHEMYNAYKKFDDGWHKLSSHPRVTPIDDYEEDYTSNVNLLDDIK